jgi:hypothetical protein
LKLEAILLGGFKEILSSQRSPEEEYHNIPQERVEMGEWRHVRMKKDGQEER